MFCYADFETSPGVFEGIVYRESDLKSSVEVCNEVAKRVCMYDFYMYKAQTIHDLLRNKILGKEECSSGWNNIGAARKEAAASQRLV